MGEHLAQPGSLSPPLPPAPFPPGLDPGGLLGPAAPLFFPLGPGEPLDLFHTFRCGQIFRWQAHGDTWFGPYRNGSLAVRRVPDGVEVRALGVAVTAAEARRFLGLDVSLEGVYRSLAFDRFVSEAISAVPGLRILRQDPWECLATYICSQWNNIPKIERSTEQIARGWGTVLRWPEGVEVAAFPPPEVVAGLSEPDLRACALGYRCGYLIDSARRVAAGEIDLEALRRASYEEALPAVLSLPGIGRKVADCILLFALDKPEACPVDVWVRRVVHELYPEALAPFLPDAAARAEKGLSTVEYRAIIRFAWERWGTLAGYAQQYLFHARRLGLLGREEGPPD